MRTLQEKPSDIRRLESWLKNGLPLDGQKTFCRGFNDMLIFYKARLVILSVPKTGTTALQTALAPYADMAVLGPPELKHAPLFRYNRWIRPMFEKVCAAEMEIAAVVREPIDWLGSWYRYRRRDALIGSPASTREISFDMFVSDYCRGKRPPHANVGSQAKFLEAQPNGCKVDHLFAYERMQEFHDFVSERTNVPFETERLNVSPSAPLELSRGTESRLRRKCAQEFELYASS